MEMAPLEKLMIISGGQTGVDRAALDFAIEHGIAHAGWCPRGRRAEDGVIAARYQLDETPSHRYDQRTRWNVRDTDATLLLTIRSELRGGTALTAQLAERHGKPWLHVARDDWAELSEAAQTIRDFLALHRVKRVNIAGPRASQEAGIEALVGEVLELALAGNLRPVDCDSLQERDQLGH
jgi:hypothetical protein